LAGLLGGAVLGFGDGELAFLVIVGVSKLPVLAFDGNRVGE